MTDLISRMSAIQACNVGASDEWSKSTKSGYTQAALDCKRNILRIKPASLELQPDPRDEVIARLVEALRYYADPANGENGWCANASVARSAIAAINAVQK